MSMVCTMLQLGGDVEQPWRVSKYNVIYKTANTQRISRPSTLPEKDRSTAIDNMHENLVKLGPVVSKI